MNDRPVYSSKYIIVRRNFLYNFFIKEGKIVDDRLQLLKERESLEKELLFIVALHIFKQLKFIMLFFIELTMVSIGTKWNNYIPHHAIIWK